MVGILVAAHGELADGLVDALELIVGEQNHIKTLSLVHGQDVIEFGENIQKSIEKLDDNEGVLVFVDLFGASPYNQSVFLKQKIGEEVDYRVITGINLPMLLEASMLINSESTLDEIVQQLLDTGKDGIKNFEQEFKAMLK